MASFRKFGGADAVNIPAEALIIEAPNQYLMPGLVDMHVHVKEENELLLFVAHGVTTVRDMWGTTGLQLNLGFPDQLMMREQIERGELFGPSIYTAGPIMEGEPATSPLMPLISTSEEARASVAWQKAQGYDFIKVYDNLTADTYEAILQAAQTQNLAVAGHVPKQVGLNQVLDGTQHTIEHLTGYIDPDTAEFLIPKDQLDTLRPFDPRSRSLELPHNWGIPKTCYRRKPAPVRGPTRDGLHLPPYEISMEACAPPRSHAKH